MRKLVAAYACRIAGTRLYGKPLQLLDLEEGVSILDHIIALTQTVGAIDATVLGVAEGAANDVFVDVAKTHGIESIRGSERDVLARLITCGASAAATDLFRITTESPFFHFEMIDEVWARHRENNNDVTVVDGLPEGCHFEIYTLETLQRSHERGEDRHRSELCSLYVREHQGEFRIEVVDIPVSLQRVDLRLTVDYPEDLVVCRRVYEHFRHLAPRIPVERIIDFLDETPALSALVAPHVVPARLF